MNQLNAKAKVLFVSGLLWAGSAAAGSGSSHPGDNPLLVGGSFGLLSLVASLVLAEKITWGPEEVYRVSRWTFGIPMVLVIALCLVLQFDRSADAGLRWFGAIGGLCFIAPNALMLYFLRKWALAAERKRLDEEQAERDKQADRREKMRASAVPESKSPRPAKASRKRSNGSQGSSEGTTSRSTQASPSSAPETTAKHGGRRSKAARVEAARVEESGSSATVMLAVCCQEIQYSEEDHGDSLPADFSRARDLWKASANDPASDSYHRACELLGKWFTSRYRVPHVIRMRLALDEDNVAKGVDEVTVLDVSEAAEQAFDGPPQLRACKVVTLDFREEPSRKPLRKGERLVRSPRLGLVALYDVMPRRKLRNAAGLARFIANEGAEIVQCFDIGLIDEALESTVTDEDGIEYTSTGSSYSGGDIELRVKVEQSVDTFLKSVVDEFEKSRFDGVSLDDPASPARRPALLADESAITRMLDEGMAIDTRVGDEPLLKFVLMAAVTADSWHADEDIGPEIQARFPEVDAYQDGLKRIAMMLLKRGADVNAPAGQISTLAVAEALGDSAISDECRKRATTANDAQSIPMLLAAERGDVASIELLLSQGARVNKRELSHGTTALMMAAQGVGGEDAPPLRGDALRAQEAAVKCLIEHGADLNARSHEGDTAIGNAVRRGHASIVKILLDAGARTKQCLPAGQSLIDLARARDHLDVIQLLDGRIDSKRA
jgi:hypothetical protein